jgi:hypothetical protein
MSKEDKRDPELIRQLTEALREAHAKHPQHPVDDPDFGTLVPYGANYMASSVNTIDGFGEVKWELGVSCSPTQAEREHCKFMREHFSAIWQIAWPALLAERAASGEEQKLEPGHFEFSVNAPEEGSAVDGAEWSIQVEHENSDGMWFIEFEGLELLGVSVEHG